MQRNAVMKHAGLNLQKWQLNGHIMHSVVGLAHALNGNNFATQRLMGCTSTWAGRAINPVGPDFA